MCRGGTKSKEMAKSWTVGLPVRRILRERPGSQTGMESWNG